MIIRLPIAYGPILKISCADLNAAQDIGVVDVEHNLKNLQEIVGGYIEAVPGTHSIKFTDRNAMFVLYCNEEGSFKNLAENRLASVMAGIPIVGDVALVDMGLAYAE